MSLHSRVGALLATLLSAALALGLPATALAAEVRSGDTVLVAAGETVNDDVYVFGNNVIIDGTVNGDVITAGSTITINGHITGDVMAAGNTITLGAPVDGTVRAAGNLLTISGPVSGDALVAGSTVNVNGPAGIGRDLLGSAGSITLRGPVGRDVKASGGTLTLASSVGGGVQAQVTDLALTNGAVVQGPISYVSNNDASIAPDAQVEGSVQRTAPPARTPNPWVIGGIDLLGLIRGFVGLAVFGMAFLLVFPRASLTTASTVERRWLASLGLGFGLLVGVPIFALLVLALGIIFGGWWISLVLMAAYAVLAVAGYLATCLWTGNTAAHLSNWETHPAWRFLLGLAIVGLITLLPVVGPLVGFAAMVAGLGAATLSAWSAYFVAPTVAQPTRAVPTPASLPAAA